ncbi:MAG: hypothetical protein J6S13_07535 [Clostridia bacterium]|nr:hypothetical protein [Clostridia bacterium]
MENKQENAFQRRFNFDNVGTKIKSFTKWYCWVSIIVIWVASIICFFAGFADDDTVFLSLVAIIAAVIMPFIIWVNSWMMYALGELVESNMEIRNQNLIIMQTASQNPSNSVAPVSDELPEL